MAIRVEGEHGSQRVVVSINGRGVLQVYFVNRDTGEVVEQWTEGQFTNRYNRLVEVGMLVRMAREEERQKKASGGA